MLHKKLKGNNQLLLLKKPLLTFSFILCTVYHLVTTYFDFSFDNISSYQKNLKSNYGYMTLQMGKCLENYHEQFKTKVLQS